MIKRTRQRNKHTATIKICRLGPLLAVSKLSSLKSVNLPLRVKYRLGPKFLEAPKAFFPPLKRGSPLLATTTTFLLHGYGSQVPSLQKHCLHPRLLCCPHIYKEIRARTISNKFLTSSLNLASFCLSDTTHCDVSLPAPWCLFLCHYSSHKAPSQMTGSSAGAAKENGRSETIIMLLGQNLLNRKSPGSTLTIIFHG